MFIANVIDERLAAMPVAPIAAPQPWPACVAGTSSQRNRLVDQGVSAGRRIVHRDERAQWIQQDLQIESVKA
jgi:hypothetical protein